MKITIAGFTREHSAILAKKFHHLVLLDNDFMKSIGLVLELPGNHMCLRDSSERTYSISCDLTQPVRIDVTVISNELRTIVPYYVAHIRITTLPSLSMSTRDASITGHCRHIATANSLVPLHRRKCFVHGANCSRRQKHVYCGQYVALVDRLLDIAHSSAQTRSTLSQQYNAPQLSSKWNTFFSASTN